MPMPDAASDPPPPTKMKKRKSSGRSMPTHRAADHRRCRTRNSAWVAEKLISYPPCGGAVRPRRRPLFLAAPRVLESEKLLRGPLLCGVRAQRRLTRVPFV